MKHPAAHLRTVRRLEREYRRATAREMATDDVATAQRLAVASDRVSRRLAAARDGVTIEPPRTRRNLALGAFAALAALGRVIARALTRAASLRRASVAAALKRTARKAAALVRAALRRAGRTVALVAATLAPSVAAAHPGHPGHDAPPVGVGLIVTVGVALGLASYAWEQWGPRRRALATITGHDGPPAGGDEPEPEPEHTEADHDAEVAALAYESDRRESEVVAALPEPEPTLLRCGCTGTDPRFQIAQAGCLFCHGVGAMPIAPFGKEGTSINALRSRAAWERKRAALVEILPYGAELAAGHRRTADDYDARVTELTAEPDLRVIVVGDGDPGDECEHTNEHGEPCGHPPRQWSIRNGSGYVVACDRHGRDLTIAAVDGGSIYPITR